MRVHTELNREPGTVRLRNNFFKKRKKGILEGIQRASLMSTGYSRADVLLRERVTEEGGGRPLRASVSLSVRCMHGVLGGVGVQLVRKEGVMHAEAKHAARQSATRRAAPRGTTIRPNVRQAHSSGTVNVLECSGTLCHLETAWLCDPG